MDLIIGIFDLRPKASKILKGKANAIPVTPKNKVTNKPPHLFVATVLKPGPPYSMKYATNGNINVKYKKIFLKGSLSNKTPIKAKGNNANIIFTLHACSTG